MTSATAEVEQLDDLAAAGDEWSGLAAASDNIFSTWEWADVWWRHFGSGRSLMLSRVRDRDETVALLPLYRERRLGLSLARFIGQGAADQIGPVCAPAVAAAAVKALPDAAARALVVAERLPSEVVAGNPGCVVLREEPMPLIRLRSAGDWESYLAGQSANFRQQVRRRGRSLERLGLRFRLSDASTLPHDLDALIGLHAARWGAESSAFAGSKELFHREFARLALERGWLRLWLGEVDGSAVAAWYGFRFAEAEYFYQSGRDPAWDRHRVGAGLLEHTIREAFADGMREYRLLRGDEAYKQRYASETKRVLTVALARTGASRGILGVARWLASAKSGRALLRRAAR